MRLKDPHRAVEYDLMVAGMKRLAYFFDISDTEQFDVDFVKKIFEHNGRRRFLVYRHRDERYARCFQRAYCLHLQGKISLISAHARIGILLGYEKAAIRYFLQRGDGLK